MMDRETQLTCHLCGQNHSPVRLLPGQKAQCTRCDTVLARGKHYGRDGALAFAVSGLILGVPACLLPFISAGKFGDERVSLLFTGVGALWDNGMRAIAMLVLLCGGLMPMGLLMAMAVILAPERFKRFAGDTDGFLTMAGLFERWAIPEVQVLAVLVALLKLGSVVNVALGPGFWCYCGMALALLCATRSFDFEALPGRARAQRSRMSP
jgi:paraquat-inducible protein A